MRYINVSGGTAVTVLLYDVGLYFLADAITSRHHITALLRTFSLHFFTKRNRYTVGFDEESLSCSDTLPRFE